MDDCTRNSHIQSKTLCIQRGGGESWALSMPGKTQMGILHYVYAFNLWLLLFSVHKFLIHSCLGRTIFTRKKSLLKRINAREWQHSLEINILLRTMYWHLSYQIGITGRQWNFPEVEPLWRKLSCWGYGSGTLVFPLPSSSYFSVTMRWAYGDILPRHCPKGSRLCDHDLKLWIQTPPSYKLIASGSLLQ